MVSMKDIAKKCNVSVATVSKALNGHTDIGEATKQRVIDMAKEMGYFPNSSARALKTNRTYNLGVLFVDEAGNGLRQDYFSAVLDSFKVTAEGRGYDITFINCNKENNRMSYLEHSRYRGVDGVVIACVDFDDPEVIELIESDVPVVTIDHLFDNRMAIMSDNTKGMTELVNYIISQGHKDIAYIHGAPSYVTKKRLDAFEKTMKANSIKINAEFMKEGAYRDYELAEKLTRELLEGSSRPTCIIYPDDYAAIGGINAVKELGLSIPEDVSIAGYDGIEIAKVLEPKMTTLAQDTRTMGKEAALKLIGLIEEPETIINDRVNVVGSVLQGASVRRI